MPGVHILPYRFAYIIEHLSLSLSLSLSLRVCVCVHACVCVCVRACACVCVCVDYMREYSHIYEYSYMLQATGQRSESRIQREGERNGGRESMCVCIPRAQAVGKKDRTDRLGWQDGSPPSTPHPLQAATSTPCTTSRGWAPARHTAQATRRLRL
jgi:hypothetical protein